MELVWVREESPVWDADKQRVIGGAPEGAFVLPFADGESLPGEWWAAREGGDSGAVVGFGRLDVTWGGDAEILLAVAPDAQERGVGSFLLEHLEQEAQARDINYVHNRIREHEQDAVVHDWLVVRGFRGSTNTDLRKRVGSGSGRDRPAERPSGARPAPSQDGSTGQQPASGSDEAAGHEEQGGYVDVDEHQY